ncbi:MAG: sigma-E factor negative regulatory protein [Rhodocyclaceae bacterium]|nr:sigma-E factor negative regulatory protein [Rhodocyclaceae bacterium]MDZ4213335.1 sigma-E factor negative regulatory protein [Rhodocyclaceae bacterium]
MRKDSELSALFDGELEDHEVATIVRAVLADEKRLADWQAYALIGDQLRGEKNCAPDFVENVMVRVREEPQVLAPRNLVQRPSHHPLLALAASVAGVAVVGWLALIGSPQVQGPQIAYVAVPLAPTFAKAEPKRPTTSEVQQVQADHAEMGEYLVAHHAHASAFHLGEGVQHVRSVSMTGDAGRP